MEKKLLTFGGFSGAMAVAMGAMGAHALKEKMEQGLLTERNLHAFETAADYQMYHAIVLVALALLAQRFDTKKIQKSGLCFMLGTVLFSGSLYLLSTAPLMGITSVKWLGLVTPIGGLFFIAGWVFLALAALSNKQKPA